MDLSVITVSFNNQEHIGAQLRSVKSASKNLTVEQIVVDNASQDKTVDLVSEFSDVKLIKNSTNLGFAVANNLALKKATGDYILFLNPDMEIFETDILVKMLEYIKNHPQIGILTCRLTDQNGRTNLGAGPRRFPRVLDQILVILKLPHLFKNILNKYYYADLDQNNPQAVDSARGAFMLVRRELLDKLGRAFDERFFVWFEDVDLCRSVWQLGYEVVYHPAFVCVDWVGRSFAQIPPYQKQKQFLNSQLKYFKKWEPIYKWFWLWLLSPIGLVMVMIFKKNNQPL
ncbi:MAG: hypothetical protein COU31_04165 [Candidatus Magasanikbacteria bacterium CG10_big_fil_rev_8_21_14_0_10_40_10]|uniref:Glycosyltransferase 2-like domain-containing protein n=1 Tax=Candidatus Magasanikbacteria bacterium CG10_big_fil_rev_8_21_14_0_10_40_10 TaxID=1974648 RepID=A0A2M6W339_9BACT|nr:MAG: hypothetical protein COU31_04165 [Candidatus Magasanikbacteria bacterium CG10_big_fil_rev_8_21_14_0_10_40_10]